MKLRKIFSTMFIIPLFLTIVSCDDPATVNTNKGDNGFMTFDFGSVKVGTIKIVNVKYTGSDTKITIDSGYSDSTMLNNKVAPNIATTCGGENDNTSSLTLQNGCEIAYSFAPAEAKNYSFTMPTDKGDITFKGVGITTGSITPKITLDKTEYTMKDIPGVGLYYDNITITQASGNINASYHFADINTDPAVAVFTPDIDNMVLSLLKNEPFNFDDTGFCTFSSETRKLTANSNSCKVLMLFAVTDEADLDSGKQPLITGKYTSKIGFTADGEPVGTAVKISVDYIKRELP